MLQAESVFLSDISLVPTPVFLQLILYQNELVSRVADGSAAVINSKLTAAYERILANKLHLPYLQPGFAALQLRPRLIIMSQISPVAHQHARWLIEGCLGLWRNHWPQCKPDRSAATLSNVILVDEKLTSFHQYRRYSHKCGTIVFRIPSATTWA